jgi:hypothetical protein
MVPCGWRQNGAFASALAGRVPEKIANVAVIANAAPKLASFFMKRLPRFSFRGVPPVRSLANAHSHELS